METGRSSADMPDATEDRIAWVLAHPGMSDWLKQTVRTALDRDPVAVLNDLEILNVLLRRKSEEQISRLRKNPLPP